MKKRMTLLAGMVCCGILTLAQTPKDPQQELNQVQQKIKVLQSADQQIKGQVNVLKKDQAALEQQVKTSLTAGDSAMKAGLDSVRVANTRILQNEKEISSLRSSLSLQQNLVIVALVLVVCLVFLFLWQRKMIRTLAQAHEDDMKKARESAEAASSDLSNKVMSVKEDLASKHLALQDQIGMASRNAESKAESVKSALLAELSGLDEKLRRTDERITLEQKSGLEAEKAARESLVAELKKKISGLEDKVGTETASALTFMKQETESYRKELADIRKSLQEVSKIPKGRGNSAE